MIPETDPSFPEIKRIGKLSRAGVFIYDLGERRFQFLNSQLINILELNNKLLMADPALVMKSIPEQDRAYLEVSFEQFLKMQAIEDVQFRWVQTNVKKLLSCSAYLTDNSVVIGFVKDISRLKEHEDYLINFGARKDAILDNISQHLSTPLHLSRFTVDLIEKAVRDKKFHKLSTHIALMREVTAECVRVIQDFMKQEHMESPGIFPKTDRFDLIGTVLVVLDKLKEMNEEKRITLKTDLDQLFVTSDQVKFFQIVHNILSNSIKFTKPDGRIDIHIKDHKDSVEIVIEDDGIGIPEELQPYIFEENTRAGRAGLNGEESVGVGLFVTKKLVSLLRGRISFVSLEDKGTTFTLRFPKHRVAPVE